MNEEAQMTLEEALAALVSDLTDAGRSATAFAADQLPQVVVELLAYKTIFYSTWIVIFMVVGIGMVVGAIRIYRATKDFDAFMIAVFSIFPFGIVLMNAMYLVKLTVAPKVYLIEYAAAMLR